jgi:hypothetical protein
MKIQRLDADSFIYTMVSVLNRAQQLNICIGESLHFSNLVCDCLLSNFNWRNKVLRPSAIGHCVEKFRIRATFPEPPKLPLTISYLLLSLSKFRIRATFPEPPKLPLTISYLLSSLSIHGQTPSIPMKQDKASVGIDIGTAVTSCSSSIQWSGGNSLVDALCLNV